jgi:hypothetical protein
LRGFFALLALAAAIVAVPAATALTPPATGLAVSGTFSHVAGAAAGVNFCGQPGAPVCPPGTAATQVHFGSPAVGTQQSGLGFTPTTTTSVPLNTNFVVGTLKHFNFPIVNGASGVQLTVGLSASTTDGNVSFSLPFTIGIDETPNTPPCVYSPVASDCPDALRLPPGGASASQALGSLHTYTLTVLGFTANPTDTTPQSQLVTQENKENTGYLVASISRNNTAPAAAADSGTTTSGGSTTVNALVNDSDVDLDPLTAVIASGPAHGTATVNALGMIVYTADLGFAGTDTFTYRASDGFSTSAPATVTITVTDATSPVLTLPADITAEAEGASGAAVTYAASASDNVDGSPTPTCAPASGSTFAIGSTQVDCSVTDAAGNTDTGSFHVTVSDTTAPTLSAVPSAVTAEATGPGGAAVTYTPPTASDAVDGSPAVTCVPPSGSTFALGTQTVSCTTTDASGNQSAPQTFTVTVSDTTAPSLTVPASFAVFSADPAGTTVAYSTTATDAGDAHPTVQCSPPSGSTFAPGTTTVTCTATDANGNTSAAQTFTVTVVTNRPPVCVDVKALPSTLWPPNGKFRPVLLVGATDPDGDRIIYQVVSITQDEPLERWSSEHRWYDDNDDNRYRKSKKIVPDAVRGIGPLFFLRAERDERGDGRVYTITFTVTDSRGASCTGTTTVSVPRDPRHPAVKSPASYNSFG